MPSKRALPPRVPPSCVILCLSDIDPPYELVIIRWEQVRSIESRMLLDMTSERGRIHEVHVLLVTYVDGSTRKFKPQPTLKLLEEIQHRLGGK